jgi:DNA modification methylase
VQQIIKEHPELTYVLDPFSGTGTTGLVCAENDIQCDLIDINPFLVWLASVKTANYRVEQLQNVQQGVHTICNKVANNHEIDKLWIPTIHNINRWWPESRLITLAKIFHELNQQFPTSSSDKDLMLVAFCNLIIHWSNAAFNHQSMSFDDNANGQLALFDEERQMLDHLKDIVHKIVDAAQKSLQGQVKVILADSRKIPHPPAKAYDCVITSPPYPNRMSYIRELRPYMYWLGYLKDGREAGELDWQTIGGTWGIATSRLQTWQASKKQIQYPEFDNIITEISKQSSPLANYVHKYFVDISIHLRNLYPLLSPNAKVFYIVGNSRFYNILVPVERIYASLLEVCGFTDIKVEVIRKRNSKKELYEFIVEARKPC